jgi:hypothetical protein
VHAALHAEMRAQGKTPQWEMLRGYLASDKAAAPYSHAAEALGMTEGAVKTAVHRLRRRFGERLRREIAETVGDPSAVDEELQDLFDALRR